MRFFTNLSRFILRLRPGRLPSGWQSALALLIYSSASLVFFGRGLIGHFSTRHIGEGADPELMTWFLVWWPYALKNRLNPFFTHAIWAHSGFNLAWGTSIPLISLVAAPLTAALGPIATLNLLCLLALPLAAWCAFFLCRYLSNRYWPSVLAGYIFGFCPMLLGQLLFGRLHSIFVFPVPLAAYFAVRRLRDEITKRRFALLLSLCLAVQFLCSPEIFATMTVFGFVTLAVAWLIGDRNLRAISVRTMVESAYAYLLALPAMAPYLAAMFLSVRPYDGPLWNDTLLSADLLNFVIPTPINAIGSVGLFDRVSGPFNIGLPSESVAFLGWPLIVLAVLFGRSYRRETHGRLLVDALIIVATCALGPLLVVRSHPLRIPLPWRALEWWVLNNAAPARFCMYVSLIFAVMTALWFSQTRLNSYQQLIFGVAIVGCLLPNLSGKYWAYPVRQPEFFANGLYRQYLQKDEMVLVLPFWPRNVAMLWQAQSDMYFRMAGGPGPWPSAMVRWPILDVFLRETYIPGAARELRLFLDHEGVRAVIVDEASLPTFGLLMAELGVPPLRVGGVCLYRLADHIPAKKVTLEQVRTNFDELRFDNLLIAVQKYLDRGGSVSKLSAKNIFTQGLLPRQDMVGEPPPPEIRDAGETWLRSSEFRYGMILFADARHGIVIGEGASAAGADAIISKYRGDATETAFLPPPWAKHFVGEKRQRTLGVVALSFAPQQLKQAAGTAASSLETENTLALN